MRKKSNKRKNIWLAGFLFILMLILILSIGRRGFIQQIRIAREKKSLERELESLSQRKKALEEQKKELNDPKTIEKIAREQYGMSKKNEKVYRVIPKEKK